MGRVFHSISFRRKSMELRLSVEHGFVLPAFSSGSDARKTLSARRRRCLPSFQLYRQTLVSSCFHFLPDIVPCRGNVAENFQPAAPPPSGLRLHSKPPSNLLRQELYIHRYRFSALLKKIFNRRCRVRIFESFLNLLAFYVMVSIK